MKHISLIYLTIILAMVSYGQVHDTGDKVGIGVSSPSAKLHVHSGGFQHGAPGEINIDASGIVGGRLKILDNGNVGIGITNPSQRLVVNGVTQFLSSNPNNFLHFDYASNGNKVRSYGTNLFLETRNSTEDIEFRTDNSITNLMTVKGTGNVGVGTTSPNTKLNVHGGQLANRISQSGGTYTELAQRTWGGNAGILFSAYASDTYVNGGLATTGNTKYKFNAGIFGTGDHRAKMIVADHSSIHFYISPTSTGAGSNVIWGASVMTLRGGGYVGIGTSSPTHKLEVNGTIRSKEVKVEANNWPDYVFEENYDLKPLEEIEAFIQSNGHLPEIPSANEIEVNGLKLGEMNRLLLKKIEELTLYTIEQQNLIEDLLSRSDSQQKIIEELKQRIK